MRSKAHMRTRTHACTHEQVSVHGPLAPNTQVETLRSEQEVLLVRAKAAQLVLQAAEAVAALVSALRERGQGEHIRGLAGSQLLEQLQAPLQGIRGENSVLESSAGEGDAQDSGGGGAGGEGGVAGGWGGGGGGVGGVCGAASGGSTSHGRHGSGGSSGGSSGDGAAKPRSLEPCLPAAPAMCWTVEQAVEAATTPRYKGYACLAGAYAPQMASLLR